MENLAAIIAGLVGLLGAVAAYAKLRPTNRKLDAEGSKMVVDIALSLVQPLEERIGSLEREVEALEVELRLWREVANRRGTQVIELGGVPIEFDALLAEWGNLNE